jgi:hypothetical protein
VLDIGRIRTLRGPNIWAECPVLELILDLGDAPGDAPGLHPEVMERLHAAITGIRFEPRPAEGGDLEWAEAGFHWEKQKEAAP